MDPLLCRLIAWGCDIDGALARVLGDEKLLVSCIRRIEDDSAFDQLGAALDAGDCEAGFQAAHTLKGLLETLGLTTMCHPVCRIVELLRRHTLDGTAEAYRELLKRQSEFKAILSE